MSTTRGQRIGIWIIAGVMVVGTIGSFFVVVIANNNQMDDQRQQNQEQSDLAKKQQQAIDAHAASSKPLDGYSSAAFDAASVTDLKVETLVQGDGTEAKASSTVTANYFGWTADGKIFDSTNQNGTVKPIDFGLSQVIQGWTKGLTGVKAGSTVRLTIPADQAYGSQTQAGQPSGPLMFIVQLVAVK